MSSHNVKIMTVDVESWVHRPIFNLPDYKQTKDKDAGHLIKAVDLILRVFRRDSIKATFFILGEVADWYPEVVEKIYSDGHEIGVHGYSHRRLNEHTRETFEEEISKTVETLTNLSEKPIGYRAPCFSYADFVYEVLEKYGFKYDSSVFPIKTPLYNGTIYGREPFMVTNKILEVPLSVYKIFKLRIPLGGFYLRLLGSNLNKILINSFPPESVIIFYFHPWEILEIPDLDLSYLKKLYAYYNLPMLSKVENITGDLDFDSVKNSLELIFSYLKRT